MPAMLCLLLHCSWTARSTPGVNSICRVPDRRISSDLSVSMRPIAGLNHRCIDKQTPEGGRLGRNIARLWLTGPAAPYGAMVSFPVSFVLVQLRLLRYARPFGCWWQTVLALAGCHVADLESV